ERRGGVLALASMGATVAALAAGAFGSAGVLEAFGWRAFFIAAGAAGLVFAAAFAWIVKEPPRGWSEGRGATTHAQVPAREILPELLRRPALVHALAGTVVNSIAVFAIAQWVVVFFERVHGLSNATASAALMWVALASTLGAVAGGVLANRAWTTRPRWVLLAPALCSAVAGPALFFGASARDATFAIALYSLAGLLALVHSAPAAAAMQGMISDRMRSVATGLIASLLTLFGMGGGPFITGFLSDLFGGPANPDSIGRALGWVSLLFLWAGAHFFLAARTFARDLASVSALGAVPSPELA
ncbi:MAG TPA: MFS transporter, partial [Myxococcota bacterium]|nr:MFS transporter [Myxococcota bacterium]